MQALRRGRNSVSALHVHLVFIAKCRRHLFDEGALNLLRNQFAKVCDMQSARLIACDGEDDHVHLLVEYPPTLSVSTLVNALKGSSSRVLRREREDIAERYFKGVLWTPSYFAASAGGAPLEVLKQYVEQQRASSQP